MTEINLKDLYEMFYEDPDFKGGLAGNPNDSMEEAAWDEAKSRFKQHKNNEKALKVGINQNKAEEAKEIRSKKRKPLSRLFGKQQNPFAIATAKAKEMGYTDFSEGSEGYKKRGEIAEAIKEQKMVKQMTSSASGSHADRLSITFPNVDENDVTNEDAVEHKEIDMDSEMVVNSVLKDLADKGVIKGHGINKMSIPAAAGLIGAGAMLAKIFKLGDGSDEDDVEIEKQVVKYMDNNSDFFEGVARMCEFVCQTTDGKESTDESRGKGLLEMSKNLAKACPQIASGIHQ